MPLVAHPVRSLWGSQPRCARCVCEWLHRKWDGAIFTGYSNFTFLAGFNFPNPPVTDPIIFDMDVINPGGHYNPRIGIYTVPIDGTYEVIFNLASSEDAVYNAHVNVEGKLVCIDIKDKGCQFILMSFANKCFERSLALSTYTSAVSN